MFRNFPIGPFGEEELEGEFGSGLSIYEDKEHVVIEAAVPGIPSDKIHLSHHHGYIIIEGDREDEQKDPDRKYYRKSSHSFAYRIPIPSSADDSGEPKATVKNGIMKITFKKGKKRGKKIPIKEES